MEPTKIPRFIDEPPILLIWTAHDLVIVVAMMLLGIFIDHLLYCLIASYFVIKFIRRFTDNRPNGFLVHACYWIGLLPTGAISIPNPYIRRFYQ
ncbi:type IV conjugative transfer system protein TraL [Methylomonas sp. UP202]|uniref:type IV conjugative transfer system protein TraL n=1 Tax=Methylomonas sp. UP202 TaxID=3040943 RepID=UPI002478B4A4|nr:type IV conjugative transfer system protein TraL [Methylomonas sp. UP202]WGS88648.1 type IV conjugative transfer system protein TraL [Methylomonas sp. UP202]